LHSLEWFLSNWKTNAVTPKVPNHKEKVVSQEVSKSSVSTIACQTIDAALPHGSYKVRKEGLGNRSPLLLKPAQQFLQIGWRGMIGPDLALKLIPKVLDWVQVRATGRPRQLVHSCLLQELCAHPGTVRRGIVVLEDGTRPHLPEGWDDKGSENLVAVPNSSQTTDHVVEGSPMASTNASPNHH
jgi:hypothetical protein